MPQPDDKVTAALDEIRERRKAVFDDPAGRNRPHLPLAIRVAEDDAPRLLAALDAALKHHQPRQLYGMVESFTGTPMCGHDPDYDGDRHFEGDDGMWYCRDKPTVVVCPSCTDGSDHDLAAEWPCPTYSDIASALLGEATTGG